MCRTRDRLPSSFQRPPVVRVSPPFLREGAAIRGQLGDLSTESGSLECCQPRHLAVPTHRLRRTISDAPRGILVTGRSRAAGRSGHNSEQARIYGLTMSGVTLTLIIVQNLAVLTSSTPLAAGRTWVGHGACHEPNRLSVCCGLREGQHVMRQNTLHATSRLPPPFWSRQR